MKKFLSLEEFFFFLNQNIEYVVLRNPDDVVSDGFLESGADIDILCSSIYKFKKLTNAKKRTAQFSNFNSYYVIINENKIPVDIYQPGDGYFDKNWEKNMLKDRIQSKKYIYSLSDEDYFYSLAYHALYQKEFFDKKYIERINNITSIEWDGNISCLSEKLEQYMKKKNYRYTYSYSSIYLNFSKVESKRIYKSFGISILEILRKLKTLIRI